MGPEESDHTGAKAQPARDGETSLVDRLREGDEGAFVELIDRYQAPLERFLRNYLPSPDLAEDVAQETWVAMLQALPRFEGRSSLKTWIFRIGANRAQARMRRERRTLSFSALKSAMTRDDDESADIEQLLPSAFSAETGMWAAPPARWEDQPETKLLSDETVRHVRETIEQLSTMQAAVITLRDMEHWTAPEVCEALEISEANQRVLLHRARMKVRKALESQLEPDAS
jgi:RNA polymerase sigma-70 factor, ECF subfamily